MVRTKYNDPTKEVIMQSIKGVKEVFGDKTKYNMDRPRQAYHMAQFGLTTEQIAIVMGVGKDVIQKWVGQIPEFSTAMHEGKNIADAKVETTLLQCCLGYERDEVVTTTFRGDFYSQTVEKTYPPNGDLCLKWLALRQPDKWAPTQKVEVNKNITFGQQITTIDITNDELGLLETIGLKQLAANVPNT